MYAQHNRHGCNVKEPLYQSVKSNDLLVVKTGVEAVHLKSQLCSGLGANIDGSKRLNVVELETSTTIITSFNA